MQINLHTAELKIQGLFCNRCKPTPEYLTELIYKMNSIEATFHTSIASGFPGPIGKSRGKIKNSILPSYLQIRKIMQTN